MDDYCYVCYAIMCQFVIPYQLKCIGVEDKVCFLMELHTGLSLGKTNATRAHSIIARRRIMIKKVKTNVIT